MAIYHETARLLIITKEASGKYIKLFLNICGFITQPCVQKQCLDDLYMFFLVMKFFHDNHHNLYFLHQI